MRIAAQLYTVRQLGGLAAQLDLILACGFADVETVGFHDLSPKHMALQVAQSGLTVRSAHFDWEEFETRFDDILTLLDLLNCPVAVMPWLAPQARPGTVAGWQDVADQLSAWAARLAGQGVRLAYHNHDFDLVGPVGETPLDLILAHDTLHWQPDIGWLAVSVPDPAEVLQRYAGRIVSVHAKDAEPASGQGDDRWRNLGQGVVDWPRLLRILNDSPCSDLFVEHDETPDHAETLRTGRKFLMGQMSSEVG
ncbi:sugar phosphate isomerase/epimerase family protein [Ruegeria arenilitoris]|uniref:sugar phosphate isomerase/epimerase family protein n=1 Tax=Ruegeria arenilitoris TaxID=1173585 RepID=UPI00147CD8BD|nr:sugar phosphate isomerase/epimerase [Ruegeria arenilitoris]